MPDALQELLDRVEIGDLLARYSTALDSRDWDLLGEVFLPDAVCDYGALGNPQGVDAITALISASCTATSGTVRFRVSDGALTGIGDLQINIFSNSAPTVGNYPPSTTVASGGSVTVTPSVAPSDNGTIASVTADGNMPRNCATPPKSQSVMPSISIPSRRACTACPSSWARSEAKNRIAAATASATASPIERDSYRDSRSTASDHVMSAKTTSQLQLIPIRIPKIRPSWMLLVTP